MISIVATRELKTLGDSNVRVYEGGKPNWIAADLPVEDGSRLCNASEISKSK